MPSTTSDAELVRAVRVPMRDGSALHADVFLGGREARPVLLHRTPYLTTNELFVRQARHFAQHDYHVVLQDVRGRGRSEGDWVPFRNEGEDGYDTVEWLAEQDWCDGRVVMYGGSYSGWVQWAAARLRPPHLRALVSSASSGNYMREMPYDHGMFALSLVVWLYMTRGRTLGDLREVDWHRVLRTLPVDAIAQELGVEQTLQEWLDHPDLDEYWEAVLLDAGDFAAIDLPVLHITGLYDADQPGALFFYRGMRAHSPAREVQSLLMGPWDHFGACGVPRQVLGGVDFGAASVLPVASQVHLDWVEQTLADRPVPAVARVFTTGVDRWRTAACWPPQTTERSLFLDASQPEGALRAAVPEQGAERAYRYDPADPVMTTSIDAYVADHADSELDAGRPLDLAHLIGRPDVLAFDSREPGGTHVAGHPRLHLVASSDCCDTDWVVALHDVAADGTAMVLAKGNLRASYRRDLAQRELLIPGRAYEFVVELSAVDHMVRPGHLLRLTVTSSDFPGFERNLNTGAAPGRGEVGVVATNTVLTGPGTPSRLVLPVVAPE